MIEPMISALLHKLAAVEGRVSVSQGVLTFPDGATVNLKPGPDSLTVGLVPCYHCGSPMNEAQRYLCGCSKCEDPPCA